VELPILPLVEHQTVASLRARVRALVPLELARLSGRVLAPGLVARVRPLAAVRAIVRREGARLSGAVVISVLP
jgi:hypothetical protein